MSGIEKRTISLDGREFEIEIESFPFRENVELRCVVDGERIRVGDRQLGVDEGIRLLMTEIRKYFRREA